MSSHTSSLSARPLALLALAALALLLLPHVASAEDAWWNDGWKGRKKLTIDAAAAGISEPIGSAVVVVRLFEGNFQFPLVKEDGSDIRFVAEDGKTVLPYHFERFDALMNEATLWVKLPEVKSGGPTNFWLYYNNPGPKAVSTNDPKGTYDADTVAAFHFGENGAPASDATTNANAAQNAGATVQGALIAGGVRIGSAPLKIVGSPSLNWAEGAPLTWSAWVKQGALQPNGVIFSRREDGRSLLIGLDNGVPFIEANGQRSAGTTAVAANVWAHIALLSEAGKLSLYVNGEPAATLATALPALASDLYLGGDSEAGATAFNGEFDEWDISRVARPVGWVKLAAFNQGAEKSDKVLLFGNEEKGKEGWFSGGDGSFSIIIKNLTLDGWLVIGVLGVMLVISWWLMWTKISYLNAMAKGNALFMRSWTQLSGDLTALDHGNAESVRTLGGLAGDQKSQRALKKSAVYRIYHIGSEQIRHRLSRDKNAGHKVLRARSIQSIRARLDGGLIREKQKIDRLIVLLTICISGGPFLGLLGTVVGVMITFAAVAAAGEVNVNAIAPGIAAALLATVAGLAVAIPSLFGYNYILSRVKDATADMHVFIDEFVTELAESYGGDDATLPVKPTSNEELGNDATELPLSDETPAEAAV